MIISYCYDVEIFPNFFSITIIDLRSYLNEFKDCCEIDNKGKEKPIPLTDKYTVKEIKEKLNKIKSYEFYITDKNDTQLLPMLDFINKLRPFYDKNNNPIRTDMFGYNSSNYDKLMIAALLMFANQTNNTKELITKLYETSKKIIKLQDNKDISKRDFYLNTLRHFSLPYIDIDIMSIFALNKIGKAKDSSGNDVFFSKSLKQTSINIKWYNLLEYELPLISKIDAPIYNKIPIYQGISIEGLNKLIDKWDRYIIDDWIEDTMIYNKNDVFIVCEMVRLFMEEIKFRYNITNSYGINVLSSSRSNIADNLFKKFYSEFSGLHYSKWGKQKTNRTALSFKKVIFPFIQFKTPELQQMLEDIKKVVIYSISEDAFIKEVKINNTLYTMAKGGLHSQDNPRELKSKVNVIPSSTGSYSLSNIEDTEIWKNIDDNSFIYIHFDIASFYPSIMDIYEIAPAHLNSKVFVKLVSWLKNTRIEAKHSKKEFIDGIPSKTIAEVLKIVINSIYGKLGYENGDLCDKLAVLKVTINGQLMILMLCEELELNGINVISANTDGIVVKLYKNKKDIFDTITTNWKKLTKLDADSELYKTYINRDINNYFAQEFNNKITYKGALNPNKHLEDLKKGYDAPIVVKAVIDYFINDTPVLETLYNATNILDFCKTQNIGRQFHVELIKHNKTVELQRNVRFYISNTGSTLYKVHNDTKVKNNLCAGQTVTIINLLDDIDIKYRNINYGYYLKEANKIIDPIKLQISPNYKANKELGTYSGKKLLKMYSGKYDNLFDEFEE